MPNASIESLFLRVLALTPEDRSAFLETLTPAVRSHLESLLAAEAEIHENGSEFLAPIGVGLGVRSPDSNHIPQFVGRFVVKRKLSDGSQGIVYLAHDPSRREDVVLKVSRKAHDAASQLRLKREAEILTGLDHPGLAKLIGLEFSEGRPVVVLEHIHGQTLRQKLETERIGPEKAAVIVAKLATAIHQAHERGIVHQDIKPANIVFSGIDPKIVDFGLARERSAYYVTSNYEMLGGTPCYISPEQATNYLNVLNGLPLQPIDHRADIFALGAVLFRVLTGAPPFIGTDSAEVLQRASKRDLDESLLDAPSIPRDIQEVCLRALHHAPNRRYETAEKLAKALQATVSHSQVKRGSGFLWILPVSAVLAILLVLSPYFRETSRSTVGDRGLVTTGEAFEVPFGWIQFTHIAIDDGLSNPQPLFSNGNPQEFDQLRIELHFEEPSYVFLFALNPDGKIQSCYPELDQQSIAQKKPIRRVCYPADSSEGFNFTDGDGQQAFFVLSSNRPIGSFKELVAKLGELSWPPDVPVGRWTWQADGIRRVPGSPQTRGAPGTIPGTDEFVTVTRRVGAAGGAAELYAITFPVEERRSVP